MMRPRKLQKKELFSIAQGHLTLVEHLFAGSPLRGKMELLSLPDFLETD